MTLLLYEKRYYYRNTCVIQIQRALNTVEQRITDIESVIGHGTPTASAKGGFDSEVGKSRYKILNYSLLIDIEIG